MQFEFPWALGPEPGRYTIREQLGEPPAHVLVIAVLGAQERRLLPRRRRARAAAAPPDPAPEPVLTSRATLVDTAALDGYEAAAAWLAGADLDALADAALARCNRVLHAHRIAAADPYAREVARTQALVVRVGFGNGERVADGRWDRARELPRPGPRALRGGVGRVHALRPQERLAALLAARDAALACEELTLRVRLDADAERWREAALGLRIAFEAALAELEPWRELKGLPERLAALREYRDDVAAAADAALQGGLDDTQIALVGTVLGRIEAALRARTAGGI
ncbi:MAG: hypothetical protein QOI64_69 [Solirubrobacteraceae bacterium]|nr:hypothetical protein [Solirubrobacteraceae bacterium]